MKHILIFILLASVCFGANEVSLAYEVGNNLYFRIFNSTGQVWNTSGTPDFEAWADGNVADYDTVLTGTGGSYYLGTFPSTANMVDGTYSVVSYLRAGGAPAVADGVISSSFMEWESNAEIDWGAMIDLLDTIIATLVDLAMPSTQAGKAVR